MLTHMKLTTEKYFEVLTSFCTCGTMCVKFGNPQHWFDNQVGRVMMRCKLVSNAGKIRIQEI